MTTEQQHDAIMADIGARYMAACRREDRRRVAVRAGSYALGIVLGVVLAAGLIAFVSWAGRL